MTNNSENLHYNQRRQLMLSLISCAMEQPGLPVQRLQQCLDKKNLAMFPACEHGLSCTLYLFDVANTGKQRRCFCIRSGSCSSVRAKKCLERAQITSIRQLAQRLADSSDDIWNVGATVLDEFKEQLVLREHALKVETVEQGSSSNF